MPQEQLFEFIDPVGYSDNNCLVLIGTKCKECDTIVFPPRTICPECLSANYEKVDFGKYAELETYTVIRTSQEGFSTPYSIGFVNLTPGSVRAFGPIPGTSYDLHIGMQMKICSVQIGPNKQTWGFEPRDLK